MTQINWSAEVAEIREEMLADSIELLNIDSVRDEKTTDINHPFGKGPKMALDKMLEYGQRDGFLTKEIANVAGHIELGQGEKILGIFAHVDVVPVNTEWENAPFVPKIKDGKVYARGALDDKGPLFAAYYAMKIVHRILSKLKKRVRLIVGSDEETSWSWMKSYLKVEKHPDLGFSPDAFFPVVNGEKGIMFCELTKQFAQSNKEQQLVCLYAGTKENMIPDFAEASIRTQNLPLLEKEIQQFLASGVEAIGALTWRVLDDHTICMQVKGKTAHSMNPETGVNALVLLCKCLNKLSFSPNVSSFIRFIQDNFNEDCYGQQLGIATTHPKMGQLTIVPVIAMVERGSKAKLILNIRYPKCITKERICSQLSEKGNKYGLFFEMVNNKMPH